jgi:hypothetical protein
MDKKPMGRPRKSPIQTDEDGNEYFVASVMKQGNTGRIYPPAGWVGEEVKVTKIRRAQ